ncbi:MAG: aliphatic sulfonate ABC transporter substrate-binding protein [Methylomicrobium sp.]|nr:aliphatic sulfonate ABC transporter substrate-binding protein [Methylomicrobium sp.]
MNTKPKLIRSFATAVLMLTSLSSFAAEPLKELRVDWAYYSPSSLVLKRLGWLEQDFKKDGIAVRWLQSQGSNKALEYLNSNSTDFGSTAGLSALLAKANGNPIKNVYIYSQPEWTALVVSKDSPIRTVQDLKGKKIAATKGTDPYLFLLRTLQSNGLKRSDIEHVHLQHADGKAALLRGQVEAWAGLDPHMAAAQLNDGARLIYRNVDFNTYGFLNVREEFARQHPEHVKRVLAAYEKARHWILDHPKETAQIISEEAKLALPVAELQLERNNFADPVPGYAHIKALGAAAPILIAEGLVKPGVDLDKMLKDLIEPIYAQAVIH